jgi:aminoglycoside phosphotransferase (APT) family kinase protein
MHTDEVNELATALGREVVATRKLAGGFSHETCLLTLADGGQVVARLGGQDPGIEAAVMTAARPHVPVPEVLLLLPAVGQQARPAMVISYVAGTPLSDVLAHGTTDQTGGPTELARGTTGQAGQAPDLAGLGAEVGRVTAAISAVRFERPGFFLDAKLSLRPQPSWSRQLPEFAESCMSATPPSRLDEPTRKAWAALCATHAPELERIDDQARLAHADLNPKNILVTHTDDGWRVDAVLDWEFSYSSSPYGDAANMARFADDYPAPFLAGFLESFGRHQPSDLPPPPDWLYLGRLLDTFALSDLVTRSIGHPVADQAAAQIRRWLTTGIPH